MEKVRRLERKVKKQKVGSLILFLVVSTKLKNSNLINVKNSNLINIFNKMSSRNHWPIT